MRTAAVPAVDGGTVPVLNELSPLPGDGLVPASVYIRAALLNPHPSPPAHAPRYPRQFPLEIPHKFVDETADTVAPTLVNISPVPPMVCPCAAHHSLVPSDATLRTDCKFVPVEVTKFAMLDVVSTVPV